MDFYFLESIFKIIYFSFYVYYFHNAPEPMSPERKIKAQEWNFTSRNLRFLSAPYLFQNGCFVFFYFITIMFFEVFLN